MQDVLIIGGGPAGMAAGLYAARYGLTVTLFEGLYTGGQAFTTHEIENYPGIQSISGPDLSMEMERQIKKYAVAILNDTVTSIAPQGEVKAVWCGEKMVEGKTIIIASGQRPRQLGVEKEDALRGLGVSYCATCDGAFYRGKDVAVVGGGDTAITEAFFLSRLCRRVYVIHRRDEFRAAKAEVDKTLQSPNVETRLNARVTQLISGEALEGVRLQTNDGTEETLTVEGLFVAIGATPNSAAFTGVTLDAAGYIPTNDLMETNLPGVFAAGDIRQKSLRQVVTAVADGAVAAHSAMEYVRRNG